MILEEVENHSLQKSQRCDIMPLGNIYLCMKVIYTTGKKYGIFFITAIFCIYVEYAGCFCT